MCDVLDTLHKGPMSVTDLSCRFAARWKDAEQNPILSKELQLVIVGCSPFRNSLACSG